MTPLRSRRAFTLVEMLAAISVMVIIAGIVSASVIGLGQTTDVQASVQRVQVMLMTARARAAQYNAPYGVVFNRKHADLSNTFSTDPSEWTHYCYMFKDKDGVVPTDTEKLGDYMVGEKLMLRPGVIFRQGNHDKTWDGRYRNEDGPWVYFTPTGRAYFSKDGGGSPMGNIMEIGIRRDSKRDDTNEDNYRKVRIYAATGMVELGK